MIRFVMFSLLLVVYGVAQESVIPPQPLWTIRAIGVSQLDRSESEMVRQASQSAREELVIILAKEMGLKEEEESVLAQFINGMEVQNIKKLENGRISVEIELNLVQLWKNYLSLQRKYEDKIIENIQAQKLVGESQKLASELEQKSLTLEARSSIQEKALENFQKRFASERNEPLVKAQNEVEKLTEANKKQQEKIAELQRQQQQVVKIVVAQEQQIDQLEDSLKKIKKSWQKYQKLAKIVDELQQQLQELMEHQTK